MSKVPLYRISLSGLEIDTWKPIPSDFWPCHTRIGLVKVMRLEVTSPGFSTDPSAFGVDRLILVGWLKRISSALCYLGGGHARQEDVEVSPTQSRISPNIQRVPRGNDESDRVMQSYKFETLRKSKARSWSCFFEVFRTSSSA